jgi:DNA-directed RNA polymerase specialized sigma24 family protein
VTDQKKTYSISSNNKGNEEQSGIIPPALITLLNKNISENLYPHDKYPRQWFPELDSILLKLFQEEWAAHADVRQGFFTADATQTSALLDKMLSLPSILDKNPHTLVMIYNKLISGFIKRLHRRPEEQEEIIQELLTRFLADKIFKIQIKYDANFSKMPSFTSYFMVCVRNIYVDIVREGKFLMLKRDAKPMTAREMDFSTADTPLQSAILEEEYAKLQAILQLYPACQGKIILCLKLKFRLSVYSSDVKRCFSHCASDDIAQLTQDFRIKKDRDLYKTIVSVFNRHEEHPVQADTQRKWIENKITIIIEQMNRMHHAAVYNSKNIADLFSLFFQEKDGHE